MHNEGVHKLSSFEFHSTFEVFQIVTLWLAIPKLVGGGGLHAILCTTFICMENCCLDFVPEFGVKFSTL